jgi:hypothetical protein
VSQRLGADYSWAASSSSRDQLSLKGCPTTRPRKTGHCTPPARHSAHSPSASSPMRRGPNPKEFCLEPQGKEIHSPDLAQSLGVSSRTSGLRKGLSYTDTGPGLRLSGLANPRPVSVCPPTGEPTGESWETKGQRVPWSTPIPAGPQTSAGHTPWGSPVPRPCQTPLTWVPSPFPHPHRHAMTPTSCSKTLPGHTVPVYTKPTLTCQPPAVPCLPGQAPS